MEQKSPGMSVDEKMRWIEDNVLNICYKCGKTYGVIETEDDLPRNETGQPICLKCMVPVVPYDLDDRMKHYEEHVRTDVALPMDPLDNELPILARLDGRAFRTFTRRVGAEKPYDHKIAQAMINTAIYLAKQVNATVAYTQSDEITLVLMPSRSADGIASPLMFGGRVQKMASVLASMASVQFDRELTAARGECSSPLPSFDCRVFNVPNASEAANNLVWRQSDAVRNSTLSAFLAKFSHTEAQGKDCEQMAKMLGTDGQDVSALYPLHFARGMFVFRRCVTSEYCPCELRELPAKHRARTTPNVAVARKVWNVVSLPLLVTIKNKVEVLLEGAVPILHIEEG